MAVYDSHRMEVDDVHLIMFCFYGTRGNSRYIVRVYSVISQHKVNKCPYNL